MHARKKRAHAVEMHFYIEMHFYCISIFLPRKQRWNTVEVHFAKNIRSNTHFCMYFTRFSKSSHLHRTELYVNYTYFANWLKRTLHTSAAELHFLVKK